MQMRKAKEVFEAICRAHKARGWSFDRYDDRFMTYCKVQGADIPIEFIFKVNPDAQVILLTSPLPFSAAADKRGEMALTVCLANYGLINGSFDYNFADGYIQFRMVNDYCGCDVSEDLINHMLSVAAGTVENYNDKLYRFSKGMLSLQEFAEGEAKLKNYKLY